MREKRAASSLARQLATVELVLRRIPRPVLTNDARVISGQVSRTVERPTLLPVSNNCYFVATTRFWGPGSYVISVTNLHPYMVSLWFRNLWGERLSLGPRVMNPKP